MKKLLIIIGIFSCLSGFGQYNSKTTALLARYSLQPSDSFKTVLNELIDTLDRNSGQIWNKLECFYLGNNSSEVDGKLNIIQTCKLYCFHI